MNLEEVRTAWIGRLVDGRFTLHEFLGGSEASVVFLTELPGDEPRKAAIKLIPAEGPEADKLLGVWALARAFSHPQLLRIIHSGSAILEGTRCVYVVSECADEVLSEIIPARPLSLEETRQMLEPVTEVLAWLHGSGFVHGHIKPANIFVIGDEIKLSSDGLLAAGAMRPVTAPQTIYDAPETKNTPLAPANDLWSLGVTLVETLTQHPPEWDRTTSSEPVVPNTLPQPFADIAHGCLRPIPTYRIPLSEVMHRLGTGHATATRPVEEAYPEPEVEEPEETEPTIEEPEQDEPGLDEPDVEEPEIDEPEPDEPEPDKPRPGEVPTKAVVPAPVVPVPVVPAPVASVPVEPKPAAARPAAPQPFPSEQLLARGRAFEQEEPKRFKVVPMVGILVVVLAILAFFYFRGSGKSAANQSQNPPAASAPEAETQSAPSPPASAGSGSAGSVAQRVMPKVLSSAQSTIHGTLKLAIRVSVDPSGKVTDASIATAGPSRYFDRVALEASQSWQFNPPRPGGHPVPSTWLLHYQFRHDSIDCTPQQTAP